jgi:DMSO/TMAO reductase YedYZ molybdopterin-dependent catalytic subunit
MLNSPMVDHNEETPDFVLGRWMFPRTAESIITGGSQAHGLQTQTSMTQKDHMGVITLQGAKDRVLYHTLRPQAKLQTVRLRLFARVRTYDEVNNLWKMKTMAVPTSATDWWHTRLHFVSKD